MCNISCGGSLLKHRRVCVLALHTALSVHPPVCGLLLFVLGSTEVLKIVHGEVTASVTTSEHPFLICDLAFVDQHAASPVRFGVSGCFGGRKQTPRSSTLIQSRRRRTSSSFSSDHRTVPTERPIRRQQLRTVQTFQLMIENQTQTCVSHDPALRALLLCSGASNRCFSPDESEAWRSRSSVEKTIVHAVSVSCRKQACD